LPSGGERPDARHGVRRHILRSANNQVLRLLAASLAAMSASSAPNSPRMPAEFGGFPRGIPDDRRIGLHVE
jgi:hypothetical protein